MFGKSQISRRELLASASTGFGLTALAGLMAENGALAAPAPQTRVAVRPEAKAKYVIFCYMSGGVSHVDSFDPKPELARLAGKPMPVPVHRTMFNNNGTVMPTQWEFKKRGKCGMEVSELFPHIAELADELAVVRSMTAKFNEHAQANYFTHSGFGLAGYPSAGAWTTYGLGTENRDLPGYVVLQSSNAVPPHGGVANFSSGFLPAQYQASIFKADAGEALRDITPREPDALQRRRLAFIKDADKHFAAQAGRDAAVEAAVRNYETAYRMQSAVPELCDISGETEATRQMYGLDAKEPQKAAYARQCLTARRLVERGVRFIELSCLSQGIGAGNPANPWDQHGQIKAGHGGMAMSVDQPIAALIKDLKQRGLLDETLIIWAGEFGRTPFSQGSDGRDHNPYGYSVWLAGGGAKGGTVYGATDELGYHAVENVSTVYDLWATVLHLMGVDHEALTYRFGGRDFRLTDVHGRVIRDIVA
ncbi:MAG: DUF1501 domain-containing protein [Pirellula sp.]|nr:DUF1501 domain-containing protein [Pirellula sp.]